MRYRAQKLIGILIFSIVSAAAVGQPVVATDYDRVQGYVEGDSEVFEGIPYAAPL